MTICAPVIAASELKIPSPENKEQMPTEIESGFNSPRVEARTHHKHCLGSQRRLREQSYELGFGDSIETRGWGV
jgi:hypothetical protein